MLSLRFLGNLKILIIIRKILLTWDFKKLPRMKCSKASVSGMITVLLSLTNFNLHAHGRIILLTGIFEKLPRIHGALKGASEPNSEAISLTFFNLHTNRRFFLLLEAFDAKPRRISMAPLCHNRGNRFLWHNFVP